jgi:hypothetical protein
MSCGPASNAYACKFYTRHSIQHILLDSRQCRLFLEFLNRQQIEPFIDNWQVE